MSEDADLLDTMMRTSAHYITYGERAGWWDTMALSHVRELGDRLVELKLWEKHPSGYGRRWFYRPLPKKK